MVQMKSLTGLKPYKRYTEETCTEVQVEALTSDIIISKCQIILLNLTWYGLNLMFLLLSVEVIPAQIAALVSAKNKGVCLGGMIAAGAVMMFVLSPLIGMYSDRLKLKSGRRRPLMVGGDSVDQFWSHGYGIQCTRSCYSQRTTRKCYKWFMFSRFKFHILGKPEKITTEKHSSLIAFSYEGSLFLYVMFYLLVTCAFVTITVPYNALVVDKSHPTQRGFISGVMATLILFGNVSGAALGTCFELVGVCFLYIMMVAILIICVSITVTSIDECQIVKEQEPICFKIVITGFYKPLKEHNFRWVFLTRFFMQQGLSTVIGFLEYWLDDMIYLPNCWTAQTAVAIMLLPLLLFAALSSLVAGCVSDRMERRKPIIIFGGILMTITVVGLMLIQGNYAYYFAVFIALVFGIGFGAYQAVDFALVMDVLPEERNKAKDMAVWHQALILPQALATPIGGLVLDLFERVNCQIGLGYYIVFSLSGFYFLLSSLFVVKLKGIK
ncbi:unnamed protein product [Acanthosepion pharaonis]|uniref:Major facilitator superfamily (MFS) profile domain-containing protein n=1 Tax=Acanthosepion pharaonis TaxID=158019 RepID=A0A812CW76_ACAPH|nr:unnamed protein product [Sepia pharaonis]